MNDFRPVDPRRWFPAIGEFFAGEMRLGGHEWTRIDTNEEGEHLIAVGSRFGMPFRKGCFPESLFASIRGNACCN
ncbi:MAG TPA: hypothetical protein VHE61_24340 [Opitutaceae bacterium]|nr:hypothetical protein [Opitutaceae bacterium]